MVTDHLGTPKELVTEDGKHTAWSGQLDTWGKARNDPEQEPAYGEKPTPKTDCPIRFQGQWEDAESGLHYNRHRYYDPDAAQYISPDPIGLAGGTNPQAYVSDPSGWVDPLGLAVCPARYERYKALRKNNPEMTAKKAALASKTVPAQFTKPGGGSNASDFITPHSQKHMFDATRTSTKNRSQFGKDINVKALRDDTMANPTSAYSDINSRITKYSKSYDFNISTRDTPTGEMRVFINNPKPDRSTQFPFVPRN